MQRAAIYVRVSTKKVSQKDSPEHQKALCQAFCEERGLEVVREYEDRDSGTSIVGRPDVQRMVSDAQNNEFDTVVFASLSRFSRDTYDSIGLKRQLVNMLKKRVVSIEDMYDSQEKDDELIFNIVASVNQKLSEQISVSSRRGIEQSARKGNFTGSFAPYGYEKAVIGGRKTLVIDDGAAAIVRMIFDLYINHKMGEKAIVNYLNSPEVAIPSPKKKGAWGITTIQRILQNEVYTGRNVFSKYTNEVAYNNLANMSDRRKKLVQRKKTEWIRSENTTHEPIIDDSVYQRAQEIRRIRARGIPGGHKKPVNVFAKMIFCKCCGSAMVTMSSKSSNGKLYYYLLCSKRRREGVAGCENGKWVPYQEMRDELIGWVERRIREQLDVEAGTNGVIDHLKAHEKLVKGSENEIKKLKKYIEQNREMMFELRKQKKREEVDEAQYKYEMEKLQQEIAELETKIEKVQERVEQQKDYSEVKVKLEEAVNELTQFDTYDEVEKVRVTLSKLITEIIVDNDGNIDVYTLLGKLA